MSVMLPLSIEPGAGARLRPAPLVQASSGIEVRLIQESSLLSVVIPVYNEARWVGEVVRRVQAAPIGKEIIVVDDGSTDGTADVLATLTEENVRIVSLAQNRGKGSALREGFARARGDVVLIQDADLEYDPGDYPRLLSPLWEGNADVVYGWRRGEGARAFLSAWHRAANRALTELSNFFTGLRLRDMETGLKAFRREVLAGLDLRWARFGFEPEFTAQVARGRRWRVAEVPVSYRGRSYAEGKKIRARDAWEALLCILRWGLFAPERSADHRQQTGLPARGSGTVRQTNGRAGNG